MNFVGFIKNVSIDVFLKYDRFGLVCHTENEDERMMFYNEEEAKQTVRFLNDSFSDTYVLFGKKDLDLIKL